MPDYTKIGHLSIHILSLTSPYQSVYSNVGRVLIWMFVLLPFPYDHNRTQVDLDVDLMTNLLAIDSPRCSLS